MDLNRRPMILGSARPCHGLIGLLLNRLSGFDLPGLGPAHPAMLRNADRRARARACFELARSVPPGSGQAGREPREGFPCGLGIDSPRSVCDGRIR